jgi:hypothetical protein
MELLSRVPQIASEFPALSTAAAEGRLGTDLARERKPRYFGHPKYGNNANKIWDEEKEGLKPKFEGPGIHDSPKTKQEAQQADWDTIEARALRIRRKLMRGESIIIVKLAE